MVISNLYLWQHKQLSIKIRGNGDILAAGFSDITKLLPCFDLMFKNSKISSTLFTATAKFKRIC